MSQHTPVVVIVGGGFGGLAAARALKQAPVKVVLIDRANHHLFQPLLYQDPLTFVLVGTERILAGHQRNLLPERLGQPSASVRERDHEPAKELD